MPLSGHCLCGSVTYTCDAEPELTVVCHCTNCQRQTGTSSSILVGVSDSALRIEGDTLRTFVTLGDDHETDTNRSFCSACGSPIVTRMDAMPGLAFIKAGTLDDTSWLNPTTEIWCRSAQPWVPAIPGGTRLERGPGA